MEAKKKVNKNSPARIQANNRYNDKTYDRINIAVRKGKKEKIKAIAESKGESLSGYIITAINRRIESGE